ncbi:16S rRNA (cytosine(967)-C(5))-methyltransferase [Piscinibacter sakaiensis]|uniref:Ribosomal RNA small subunit methyltransferase B n=1 Tax=Piscinibacter sakaiensis TaxID=1547922 RepID=A0A0K8NYP2_PISS1|nr:16S rRNA (cytosine(967)-C(5))-methyltransferase [Piscinibacter sakaiensis]GAP35419.1 ribosomal RNA small subunit methyltransferase B [Piscinibacter sakaiensis]
MTSSLPLARLLAEAAEAVRAVRAGQSLTEALARCPADARPGAQALAFDALRRLGSAQALRARLVPKPPPAAADALLLTVLALLRAEPPRYAPHTLVDQAVAAARLRRSASPAFVNAVLRRALRERADWPGWLAGDPVAVHEHPRWWIERLQADWPAQWEALLAADAVQAPMTLRPNLARGTLADYQARLAAAGLAAERQPLPLPAPAGADALAADTDTGTGTGTGTGTAAAAAAAAAAADTDADAALRLLAPVPVERLPGFADGAVSVQDAGAQVAARLLLADVPGLPPLAPGARVLDACAAPGGKTAQLLEQSPVPLDLLALDRDPQRLRRVEETLQRLGLRAGLQAADAGDPAAWWDGRPFDAILLDAPCSASGIVRRHPDVRWLRRASDIPALAATQARLLEALWPLLAPGGRLVYCTCSVFREEGQDRIDAFLQQHPEALVPVMPASPGHLLPLADNRPEQSPAAVAPWDGFFVALLTRRGPA